MSQNTLKAAGEHLIAARAVLDESGERSELAKRLQGDAAELMGCPDLRGDIDALEARHELLTRTLIQSDSKHGLRRLRVGLIYAAILGLVMGLGWWGWNTPPISVWRDMSLHFEGFRVTEHDQEWGRLRRGRGVSGEEIRINGQLWKDGLGTHAKSTIKLAFTRDAEEFSGICGYPDHVRTGRITCRVMSREQVLFESTELSTQNPAQRFRVPVKGRSDLILEVQSATAGITAAHAVWVDLKLR